MVVFSLYTIGRLEKHYQNADKFIPERWIRNEQRKKVNSYAYIPFGKFNWTSIREDEPVCDYVTNHQLIFTLSPIALGSRSCIGKKVAEAQMAFFISKVIQMPSN